MFAEGDLVRLFDWLTTVGVEDYADLEVEMMKMDISKSEGGGVEDWDDDRWVY